MVKEKRIEMILDLWNEFGAIFLFMTRLPTTNGN